MNQFDRPGLTAEQAAIELASSPIPEQRKKELLGALAALERAGQETRRVAIETNTAIVILRDGKLVHVTADELRKEREP